MSMMVDTKTQARELVIEWRSDLGAGSQISEEEAGSLVRLLEAYGREREQRGLERALKAAEDVPFQLGSSAYADAIRAIRALKPSEE